MDASFRLRRYEKEAIRRREIMLLSIPFKSDEVADPKRGRV